MRRYVRYHEVGSTASHVEKWVDNEKFRELVSREMKGEIKRLQVIKKDNYESEEVIDW